MINLIPMAQNVKEKNGFYTFPGAVNVFSEIELPLVNTVSQEDGAIRIFKDDSLAKDEYCLKIDSNGVKIKASDKIGAYYALQSVRMLGRFDEGKKTLPYVEIKDKPRFEWRGLSLDESRHFFGKEYIKKYLDEMFRLKLNVFHWHLTDDQGWRIEIKKYPLLTEIGSKRAYTHIGGWKCTKKDETPYGGYYTQEDIKEIVEYAKERCISIVPEIDVPAHFAAALAAYPELACRNLKREVPGYFGGLIPTLAGVRDWNRPLCMGKESSIKFMFDVYDEVCELFPFEYFHVGGDECDVSEWKTCPDCQRAMKDNNLTSERDLQRLLTNKLCEYLKSKGKHMIGWNEVLKSDGVDKSVVVQQWLPGKDKNCENYINNGGKLIMSNHSSFYFDMTYAQYPLQNTYNFNPSKYGVNSSNIKNILGVEGELWTEWIGTTEKVEFLLHPRMEALAEVAWLDEEKRDFNDFLARYNEYKSVYKKIGLNYAFNEIAMPKGFFKRSRIKSQFFRGNPDMELQQNKKLKGEQ